MKRNQPVGTPFREGRKGVGRRYTPGHPVVWSDYVTAATPGYSAPTPAEPQSPVKLAARPSSVIMHPSLKCDIATRKAEGGAAPNRSGIPAVRLTGTAAQVEWAERIKRTVNDRFDRVAASFRLVAEREIDDKRAETEEIIAILEDKRAEVMSQQEAGYFIHDWQEIGDRVGKMIVHDPRYRAIRCNRDARRLAATGSTF
jgi:hypothetical protein